MVLPVEKERYTYSDYCTWDDSARWELINGEPYMMAPGPTQSHQECGGELYYQLRNFLKDKPCKVFIAPFDVRLNADTYDDIIVQPDLLVVCDKGKLDGKCCVGAPDIVIEVLSASTVRRDRFVKFHTYEKAGVREYWIVDPDSQTVQVHILKDGAYNIDIYGADDTVPVCVLEGCEINLADVFTE